MTKDPWHFERRELAIRTLSVLTDGPAKALTMFAPRRTGKTEFLIKDLAPLAEDRGHRVIYASFWQAPLSPLAVLLHAFELSLKRGKFSDRLRNTALALTPKLRLSTPMPGAKAEAEIDLTSIDKEPPTDLLLHLDDLLDRLARKRKPTILLLDEIQELAKSSNNAPLVAALRTSLDKRSSRLKVVFTGSSREGLAAMFSARQAPFFHFATPIELESLGAPFVDHLIKTFRKTSRRTLDRGDMVSAFERLHSNPYFFRNFIEVLLLDTTLSIKDGVEHVRHRIAVELGYPVTWLALTPIQRATAQALAEGMTKPFSQTSRKAIAKAMGEGLPSIARVQAALRKLSKLGLADTYTGSWALDDPEFAAWVRETQPRP